VPLDEIDFEIRDYLPHSGWPIGREDLTPYYARAARYCEIGEAEFTKESALPSSPPFLLRHGMAARFTDTKLLRYSRPTDFGARYRERLESSRSLRTFLHANVIKLEMDSDNRIASAVVATSPGVQFRVDARFYLLACGGLETTRLLLVSDLPATRSDGSVGALGHYYMTHLDGFVGAVKFHRPVPTPVFRYDRSPDGVYCRRLACLTEETMRTERLLNFSSVFHMPPPEDPAHRDGLLSAYAITKHALARSRIGFKSRRAGPRGTRWFPFGAHLGNVLRDPRRIPSFGVTWLRERSLARRKLPSFLMDSQSGLYRFHFSAEQSPSYSNTLSLASEPDGFGVPRLKVTWRVAASDCESILRSLAILAEDFSSLGIATVHVPRTIEDLSAAIGGGFVGGTHAMGTARMSASPRQGVVDGDCHVHGVPNLYLATSAVFPTGGFGAPTLTIVALAIRATDRLRAALDPSLRPQIRGRRGGSRGVDDTPR
jgi:hypothetical protein